MAMEARERERTGITNLCVEYNKVSGFYIEVTRAQSERVPPDYHRRQTLKNVERYITPELKAFEAPPQSGPWHGSGSFLRRCSRSLRPTFPGCSKSPRRSPNWTSWPARLNWHMSGSTSPSSLATHHPRGSPPGGEDAGGGLHPQRRHPHPQSAHAGGDRAQHRRQVHLHAPDRAHRAHGLLRSVRAGAVCRHRPSGPDLHPHRRRRRPRWRTLHLR